MPYPIAKKLVVAISSNALFNLKYEDNIYKNEGIEAYKKYQIENKSNIIEPGAAFAFIKRFLDINKTYSEEKPG